MKMEVMSKDTELKRIREQVSLQEREIQQVGYKAVLKLIS